MNKDELIVKQQIEIEALKRRIEFYRESARSAYGSFIKIQQWDMKDDEFPKVSMSAAIFGAHELRLIIDGER